MPRWGSNRVVCVILNLFQDLYSTFFLVTEFPSRDAEQIQYDLIRKKKLAVQPASLIILANDRQL